jgi:hypothetical protein
MRTLDSIGAGGSGEWPEPGWVECCCANAEIKHPQSGNRFVEVVWEWEDGSFKDRLYITERTVGRLAGFVKALIPPSEPMSLPDDDRQAASVLGDYIADNAAGVRASVEIIDRTDQDGKLRRQVSFRGYKLLSGAPNRPAATETPPPASTGDDNLPF